MPEYDNNNKGVLFINDKRESESHPHMKGSATIDGKEYWVSAWSKTSPKVNGKFLSFAYTPKDNQQESKPARSQQAYNKPALDDDEIPF